MLPMATANVVKQLAVAEVCRSSVSGAHRCSSGKGTETNGKNNEERIVLQKAKASEK